MHIERITPPTPEAFIENWVARNRPVIITGALGDWRIAERWTPQHLRGLFGDEPVQVYNSYFDLFDIQSLSDFLEAHFWSPHDGSERPYARWYTQLRDVDFPWADAIFAKLADHWQPLSFMPVSDYLLPPAPAPHRLDPRRDAFPAKGLFISGAGAKTKLHADPWGSDAVLCQLYGRKHWSFYSPDQAELLQRDGVCVDLDAPDLAKFPRFGEARPTCEGELAAGEVVYVPHGWFHHVVTETPSISLTWNFVHRATAPAFRRWLERPLSAQDLSVLQFFFRHPLHGLEELRALVSCD